MATKSCMKRAERQQRHRISGASMQRAIDEVLCTGVTTDRQMETATARVDDDALCVLISIKRSL